MLILDTRSDQFRFDLPIDLIPQDIAETYNKVFVQQPTQIIYDINDLLHDSIQTVSLMGISMPIVTQNVNKVLDDSGMKKSITQFHKGSKTIHQALDKRIQVTCRLTNGGLNYFCCLESLFRYANDKRETIYFQPCRFVATYGGAKKPLFGIDFIDVVFSAISELTYDKTRVDQNVMTFTLTFVYNDIKFRMPSEISQA